MSVLDGNGEFPLFNTNADVIFPGSLLQGKTLSDATPKTIVVGRAGGTVSYDLNNGNLLSTFTVDEVKKSTIQNGMNTIISGAGEIVPADFQIDIIQVESESQVALEMGIKVKTFTTEVEGNMSFSTEKEYNRTLVKVNQSYYTMSFDLPTNLDQIFGENVTPEDLAKYVQADNPATFFSSVTYGRIFYMLIESTSSREEMQTSLKLTYDAATINGSGSIDVETFDSLKEVKIKAIAYGGDAKGAFQLLGETSIAAIASKIGASTDIRAGLPLSYVVRSVERPDEIVGTKLATQYDIVNCKIKGILPPINYRALVDVFEDGIGAAVNISGTKIVRYNKAGDKYIYYDVNKLNDPISTYVHSVSNGFEVPMGGFNDGKYFSTGNVGAAIRFGFNRIYLFNMDGTHFVQLNYDSDLTEPLLSSGNGPEGSLETNTDGSVKSTPQGTHFSNDPYNRGTHPFSSSGINAAINNQWDRGEHVETQFFSNDGKDQASLDRSLDPSIILYRFYSWRWEDKKSTNIGTLTDVGAATKVYFGPNTYDYIYFNEEGSLLYILDGDGGKGPFVVN